MELTQHVPLERVQNRVGEQIGVPVPQIKEDVVDGIHVVPQEPRKKAGLLGTGQEDPLRSRTLVVSSALGKCSLWRCVIIVVTRLAQWA